MLKIIHPLRLIVFSFLLWLVAYLLIPATYEVNNSFYPITVLALYNLFLVFGFYSVKKRHTPAENFNLHTGRLSSIERTIIVFMLFFGVFGALLKLYQLFVLQKIHLVNAYQLRESLIYSAEFNSGFLGIIIALTFPFTLISFFSIFYYQKFFSRGMLILSGSFASIYLLSSFLNESRLPIALAMFMFFVVWVFYQKDYGKFLLNATQIKIGKYNFFEIPRFFFRKNVIIIIILFVTLISFSTNVMLNRLNHYNYRDVLTVWEGYHGSVMDDDFKKRINSLPKAEKNLEVSKYSLYHYFAHGTIEFQRLVNHVDDKNGIFYGRYELDVYVKLFRFMGLDTLTKQEMDDVLYKKGYYTTFWGPFYLDFGLWGLIICFFLGRYIYKVFLNALDGKLTAILMYAYIAVNLVASFHVTFFGSAYIYVFNAIVVFWLLLKFFKISRQLLLIKNRTKTYVFK